jgi:hypothetical protein
MNNIILPGGPGWNQPAVIPQAEPEAPKLPNEVLEAAFSEVVEDVKATIDAQSPEVPLPVAEEPKKLGPPNISYECHRPQMRRSIPIPMQHPMPAELLEDLPRSWERKSGFSLRAKDAVLITGATFFPGHGLLYDVAELSRHWFWLAAGPGKNHIP